MLTNFAEMTDSRRSGSGCGSRGNIGSRGRSGSTSSSGSRAAPVARAVATAGAVAGAREVEGPGAVTKKVSAGFHSRHFYSATISATVF